MPARMIVQLTEEELEALVARATQRAMSSLLGERTTKAQTPDLLTVQEAAACLRCSVRKVRRLVATKTLPAVKVFDSGSSRVLISRDAIEQLISDSSL